MIRSRRSDLCTFGRPVRRSHGLKLTQAVTQARVEVLDTTSKNGVQQPLSLRGDSCTAYGQSVI